MRYNSIKDFDMKQGDGINVSLWVQGCSHRCEGCHNQETWNFNGGKPFTHENVWQIVELLKKDEIHKNLSILGGEPLEPSNYKSLAVLITYVKMLTDAKIWIWTGYNLENLLLKNDEDLKTILENTDYIIDGRFIKDCLIESRYKGSSNQRVINLAESRKKGDLVIVG